MKQKKRSKATPVDLRLHLSLQRCTDQNQIRLQAIALSLYQPSNSPTAQGSNSPVLTRYWQLSLE
jgi:hypothetical protein